MSDIESKTIKKINRCRFYVMLHLRVGDLDKAAEILRVKGIAKASKKMSRSATEGVVVGDEKVFDPVSAKQILLQKTMILLNLLKN